MKQLLAVILFFLFLAGCKGKAKDPGSAFFPAVSYIRGQVKDVDTGIYRIMVVDREDTTYVTSYIRREDFARYAREFTDLPDISTSKWRDDYEESKQFDEIMNSAILSYTTREPGNLVQNEYIVLDPTNSNGNNDVQSIVINTQEARGKDTVLKNLVWYTGKRFTVVTKTLRQGQPDRIHKREVIWNDFSDPSSQ